jgi:hypothetical protein
MTKLNLVLARLRQLPPERQEAIAAEIELRLEKEGEGSFFTDEEWAEIELTLDEDDEKIPHEQVLEELRRKFPG